MSRTMRMLLENGLIVIGLLTFWPFVFGHRSMTYQLWMLLVLGLLAWLAVVRLRRVLTTIQTHKDQHETGGGYPPTYPGNN